MEWSPVNLGSTVTIHNANTAGSTHSINVADPEYTEEFYLGRDK